MEKTGEVTRVDYRGLVLLCLGHMVADLNTNALPALLPFLKDALGLSYAMAGTIVLFSNLTSSVIQPIFGYLADRRSLHWFLPAGCFLAGLGISLLGWAPNYPTILILVIVSGVGVAIYHPEGWRIANFFAGEKKATGMSIFAVGGNLGFAFGPPLGIFFVMHYGLKGSAIFIVPGILMAAVFLFSRFWRIRRPSASPPGPFGFFPGCDPPGPLPHVASPGDDHVPLLDPHRAHHLHSFLLHQLHEGRPHAGGDPSFRISDGGHRGNRRGRAFCRPLRS